MRRFLLAPALAAVLFAAAEARPLPLLDIGLGDLVELVPGFQKGAFGRPRFNVLSEDDENKVGARFFNEILKKERKNVLPDDAPAARQVKAVADRVIRATNDAEFQKRVKIGKRNLDYEVKVLRHKERNALCLPGGKIVFFTGILPVCKTDVGLAFVMAHEIGHALAGHGAENLSHHAALDAGVKIGTLGKTTPAEREKALQAVRLLTMPVALRYSRLQETEADHIGILLMAAAGYDPREAARMWERMRAAQGSEPPEFLSTHPANETRIRKLEEWRDEAEPLYRAAKNRVTTPTPLN